MSWSVFVTNLTFSILDDKEYWKNYRKFGYFSFINVEEACQNVEGKECSAFEVLDQLVEKSYSGVLTAVRVFVEKMPAKKQKVKKVIFQPQLLYCEDKNIKKMLIIGKIVMKWHLH